MKHVKISKDNVPAKAESIIRTFAMLENVMLFVQVLIAFFVDLLGILPNN